MRSSAMLTSLSARYTYASRTCARWEKSAGANAPASKAARNSRSLIDKSCFNMWRGLANSLSSPSHPPSKSSSGQQTLRDLHGVQRRALAQLIAGHEQRERTARRIADVAADAPDQHFVLAAGV